MEPTQGRADVSDPEIDLTQHVERGDGITVLRGGDNCRDWNGIHYKVGMSRENVGATRLSMNVPTVPARGVAHAQNQ